MIQFYRETANISSPADCAGHALNFGEVFECCRLGVPPLAQQSPPEPATMPAAVVRWQCCCMLLLRSVAENVRAL